MNKPTAHIQNDIDTIRLNYEARMNLNQYCRDRMVGWCLVAAIVGVPAIAAAITLIFKH